MTTSHTGDKICITQKEYKGVTTLPDGRVMSSQHFFKKEALMLTKAKNDHANI